jgi:hypothetical protein
MPSVNEASAATNGSQEKAVDVHAVLAESGSQGQTDSLGSRCHLNFIVFKSIVFLIKGDLIGRIFGYWVIV